MDIRTGRLLPDQYYHIFNRGINGSAVFFEEKNYHFFLERYDKYLSPYVDSYAYCLLRNHFHFLIRVKPEEELLNSIPKKGTDKPLYWHVSNAFSSLFQSYTRAMNKVYSRTGPLFEHPFKRIEVNDEKYFSALIAYIHRNPSRHKLMDDFRKYPHSSYTTFLKDAPTKLERKYVLDWFGGKKGFETFHASEKNQLSNAALMLE